jgi:protein-disulfide isomerase
VLETEPQLKQNYVDKGQVRLVFKHFPLPSHPHAAEAAEAAECASRQKKFWEMKDLLFEKNDEWGSGSDQAAIFEGYAKDLGLDTELFRTCYENGDGRLRWQQDVALGEGAQVNGTPNFFIIRMADRAALPVPGFIEYGQFQEAIDQILAEPLPTEAPSQ